MPASTAGLKAAGGTLGAGLVVALPETACGLATTARVVRCLAPEGAVALVRSTLTAFADDVRQHRTASCGRPPLELPT